jgi:thiamine-monophosphate kinase
MEENDYAFPYLGEFRLIQSLLKDRFPLSNPSPKHRFWVDAGDDAAGVDGWLITKDLSMENTHFLLDYSTMAQAVEKHIVSNVSDISSMGGVPMIAFLGLGLNRHWNEDQRNALIDAFQKGFKSRGIRLLGGDTVVGDVGFFSTTLLGQTTLVQPLKRSSAKPGERVYVQGTLGKSAAGLWVLLNHPEDRKKWSSLVEYHLSPVIKERAGEALAEIQSIGACIDISDGLSSELNHIASSSRVQLVIEKESLPVDPEVLALSEYYGLSPYDFALNGGEEYQLLFTSSCSNSIFYNNDRIGPVYDIGYVQVGSGVEQINSQGIVEQMNAQSWSHL